MFHTLIFHKFRKISWPEILQKKFFPNKSLKSILSLYVTLNSCEKSEKFHAVSFHKS